MLSDKKQARGTRVTISLSNHLILYALGLYEKVSA